MVDIRGAASHQDRLAAYHAALRALKPGVHMLIVHPGYLDEELRAAITGPVTTAAQRDSDRRVFLAPETRQLIRELGIQLVGWQDVVRGQR